ncbi:MAG: hypothetical protein PHF86_14490 [Candidatus Nanoarchaeia archaeon]|nr:hypothetical protein [Candidatus Nanoarchaeia archaeon]
MVQLNFSYKFKDKNELYRIMVDLISEGQELDLPDKVLIRNEINSMIDNFPDSPELIRNTIFRLYLDYLNPLGFVAPRVEKWIDSNIKETKHYIENLYLRGFISKPFNTESIKRPKTRCS